MTHSIIDRELQKHYDNYPITKKHFKVNDTVWYVRDKVVKAKVIQTSQDFHKYKSEGDCIDYWIEPEDINWFIKFIDKIKFNICFYFGLTYKPNWRYPGHAVVAGQDIFRTKEEAEVVMELHNLQYYEENYVEE